jgi:ATP-dependent NAD(P)H-hydrate dehydratase
MVFIFCYKEASIALKCMSPDLIVIPLLPFEQYEEQEKLSDWINTMHAVCIGSGLGRDLKLLKNFEFLLKCLKNKLVVGDADFLWFLMQDFENYNKLLKSCKNLVLTPNAIEFSRLYKFLFKKEFEFSKLDALLTEYESDINEIVEIELYKRFPEFKFFFEIFDNKNLYFILKYKNDIIFGPERSFIVKNKSSLKRCGGQGDILAGLANLFLLWSLEKNLEIEIGLYLASYLTRKSSYRAFNKKKLGLVASDIIPEITELINSYIYENKNNSWSESDFGVIN